MGLKALRKKAGWDNYTIDLILDRIFNGTALIYSIKHQFICIKHQHMLIFLTILFDDQFW